MVVVAAVGVAPVIAAVIVSTVRNAAGSSADLIGVASLLLIVLIEEIDTLISDDAGRSSVVALPGLGHLS